MRYLKIITIAGFMAFSASAGAVERDTQNMDLKYNVYWSGFHVGEMSIKLRENDKTYKYTALIDSLNIAKYFTKYWSVNNAEGDFRNGEPQTLIYDSKWSRKKDNQVLHVQYSPDGDIVEETAQPAKKEDRPAIAPDVMKFSLDPITSAVRARAKMKEILASGVKFPTVFKIPVYDAKRRFDMEYTMKGYQEVTVDGKNHKLLHVSFQRKPVAGFRDKEIKRMKEQEPVIDAYFNKDLIPVWGLGTAELGIATIKLAQYCIGDEACLGAQEVAAK